eukprot:CAMPEP_0117018054 /NCGR_PEP_ID=MMETSP0472-20121206/13999_1 /TAXON_ID=693140 ORGANISM="Tiarina fusus, Strain LIS" /NCGR_SAMPLE_ID=MMETSP0472 /ASSEMBLY_ACC=CAM_ASM_000603 /LENGTH=470 /DNA_ID=CAMNT_0004722569 /DNA_START=147 /DNA_END=1559 /DNA_ORIENTATION=+
MMKGGGASSCFSGCGGSGEAGWAARIDSAGDDATLAREMNELSVQEREKIYDDIHGVAAAQEETPESVATCLLEFDACLSDLPYVKRKDLDRAFFLRPELHNDKEFKLLFLRADNYNAYQAVERMAKYFTNKLILFGEDKLVKKITFEDMSEQDMKVLISDGNIVLPHRDRAGRPIWFSDCSKADYEHTASTMRAFWYLAMATVEDQAAQALGISCVLYCPGGEFFSNLPSMSQVTALLLQVGSVHASLPCRISSFHFGTDEPRMRFFLSTLQQAFGKQVRLRLRSHFGSAMEMRYSLLTFGIQCEGLLSAVDEVADMKPEILLAYREGRLELERKLEDKRNADAERTGVILYPAPTDVLLGRGRPYQDFSGNRRFAELIDTQMTRFRSCRSQFEKTCVIMDVVKTVHDSKGRFLKRTAVGWEVISDEVARKKAGTTFRTRTVLAARETPSSVPSNRGAKRMKMDPSPGT